MALLYDTLVSGKNTNQFLEKNNDEYDICGGSCASQRVHFAIDVVEQASEHYRTGRHCKNSRVTSLHGNPLKLTCVTMHKLEHEPGPPIA